MSQLDATLAALADPHRRSVVDLLRREPRRAGDLADELGVSRPAMSRHLKVLRRTGLIEPASDDADARARIYRLLPEPFSALRRWLEDVEQFWRHELDAFRRHAEAVHGARIAAAPSTAASGDSPDDRTRPGGGRAAPGVNGRAPAGQGAARQAAARSSARRTRAPATRRAGQARTTARAASPARRGRPR